MFQGSCLCGAVSYKASQLIGPYVQCHCPSCRKASGSAFAVNISVPLEKFTIVTGESKISVFESSPNKLRHFCSICGSPLYTKVGANPDVLRLRLGSLDSPFKDAPAAHIFAGQKAPWHRIYDDLPQYEDWPDATEMKIPGSRQSTLPND